MAIIGGIAHFQTYPNGWKILEDPSILLILLSISPLRTAAKLFVASSSTVGESGSELEFPFYIVIWCWSMGRTLSAK